MNKIKETKKIMKEAIQRFAGAAQLSDNDVQIVIYAKDEDGSPGYLLLHNMRKHDDISFSEIYGDRKDPLKAMTLGRSSIEKETSKVLRKAMKNLSEDFGLGLFDLRILVEHKEEVNLTLMERAEKRDALTFEKHIF